jgi:hypothetical protein
LLYFYSKLTPFVASFQKIFENSQQVSKRTAFNPGILSPHHVQLLHKQEHFNLHSSPKVFMVMMGHVAYLGKSDSQSGTYDEFYLLGYLLHADFLFGLFFNPENGSDMFLRIVW